MLDDHFLTAALSPRLPPLCHRHLQFLQGIIGFEDDDEEEEEFGEDDEGEEEEEEEEAEGGDDEEDE